MGDTANKVIATIEKIYPATSHAEQYIINSRYYGIIGNVMKRKKSLVAEDNDEHFKMFKSYLEETRTP